MEKLKTICHKLYATICAGGGNCTPGVRTDVWSTATCNCYSATPAWIPIEYQVVSIKYQIANIQEKKI